MSTIKANALTGATTNSDLTLSGNGTGGVKLNDYFVQTKGSDISSATSLTLGKDGNLFDVTGTTTITTIGTQGIGSIVILQFDGALTFTHHSTNLILPGATNIITGAGDIIRVNQQTLDTSQTFSATDNGSCAGPFSVANGVTLTVTSGATFTVI